MTHIVSSFLSFVLLLSGGASVGIAKGDTEPAAAEDYVVIRHIGQQDKPITIGIIGMSEEGMQALCGPKYVRCAFIVLPRPGFLNVLGYARSKGKAEGLDRSKWPKGYAPLYGTFEVAWRSGEAKGAALVDAEIACSYFKGLGHLDAAGTPASLGRYTEQVRKRLRCDE